jgi:hypothetical protein
MFNYNKKNKYRNIKVEIDGETFASRKEARRYYELKLLERAGEIKNLQKQVKFLLIPSQFEEVIDAKGKSKQKCIERECVYVADFQYQDAHTGELIVEDTKGMRTKDYIIKRKLMLSVYKIRIKEI